jgi:hypothetical protein
VLVRSEIEDVARAHGPRISSSRASRTPGRAPKASPSRGAIPAPR